MGSINEAVACSIQQHHPEGRPPVKLDAAIKLASSIAEALYRFGQAVLRITVRLKPDPTYNKALSSRPSAAFSAGG
jgi:hypothetical protein